MSGSLNGGPAHGTRVLLIVCCLYAAEMTISMAAMEILGSVLTLWGLFAIARAPREFRAALSAADAAAVALAVAIAASLAASPLVVDWGRGAGMMRSLLGFVAIRFAVRPVAAPPQAATIVRAGLVTAALIGLYGLMQHLLALDPYAGSAHLIDESLRSNPPAPIRATGIFTSSMTYGGALILPLFLALGAAASPSPRRRRVIAGVAAAAIAAGILSSYQRGPWVGVAAGLVAITFFAGRKARIGMLLGVAAICVVTMVTAPHLAHRIGSILDLQMTSNRERFDMWRASWAMFVDHPWLGVGYSHIDQLLPEYYRRLGVENGFVSHAHNNVMDFLAGGGLFATLSYLALTALLLLAALRLWRAAPAGTWARAFGAGFFCGQVAFFVAGFTECNFKDHELTHQLLFWGALACAALQAPRAVEHDATTPAAGGA